MQIDIDLTTFLAQTALVPVEQNKLSEDKATPAVYFVRRPSQIGLFLNGSAGLQETNYDVEVYGEDIDAVETLADTLRAALNGYKGTMGTTQVLGAFVSDVDEDYQSKVEMATDEGLNVSSFSLQILH